MAYRRCAMRRLSVSLVVLVTLVSGSAARAQAPETADAMAERMLAAVGGRAAWAQVTNTVNDSQQNRVAEPTVVRSIITMDFTRPRFRVEATAPNLHGIRVIDGPRNWRTTRDGTIEDVPAELVKEEMAWYAGHVYRTLHRIAARDPALRLAVNAKGRLEVYEGAVRIAWYALDVRGEPYAFGRHQDEAGTISGPWDFEHGGIRHPLWVSSPDGTWRANIKTLAVNVPLTDAMFARPEE